MLLKRMGGASAGEARARVNGVSRAVTNKSEPQRRKISYQHSIEVTNNEEKLDSCLSQRRIEAR